jgi:hypothetical protein
LYKKLQNLKIKGNNDNAVMPHNKLAESATNPHRHYYYKADIHAVLTDMAMIYQIYIKSSQTLL